MSSARFHRSETAIYEQVARTGKAAASAVRPGLLANLAPFVLPVDERQDGSRQGERR